MSEHITPVMMDLYLKDGNVKRGVSFFTRPYGSNPMNIETYRHHIVEMFNEERMAEKLIFCPYLDDIEKLVIHAGQNEFFQIHRNMVKSLSYGDPAEYERTIH